jgi:hypothetical protein
VGEIKFEGLPPYALPAAQTAEARAEGEIVEMTLTVSAPDIQPRPVQIRIQMTWAVARGLGQQLAPVSMAAEMNARHSKTP